MKERKLLSLTISLLSSPLAKVYSSIFFDLEYLFPS